MSAQRSLPRVRPGVAYAVVSVLVVLAGIFVISTRLPPSGGGSGVPDPVSITTYDASFTVDAQGTLRAVETIDAQFPYGRHGIFRFWDEADPADPAARYPVTVVSITRDGVPEDYDLTRGDNVAVAKIGRADTLLEPGNHRYVLTYSVPNVLRPLRALPAGTSTGALDGSERSVFAWWVVAQHWEMSIASANVRVTLPAPITEARCRAGEGAVTGCTITGGGTSTVTVTARGLAPLTGVEVAAYSAAAPSSTSELPWGAGWDEYLGSSRVGLLLVLLLTALGGFGGYFWVRSVREQQPGSPLQYEPPPGLGPVQCVYLVTESTGDAPLTATVLHLAEQRLVTLEQVGSEWRVRGAGDEQAWAKADPVSVAVADALGVRARGASFLASATEPAGQRIRAAIKALESAVSGWTDHGLSQSVPHVWLGRLLVLVAIVVGFVVGIVAPAVVGLPFAVFAVAAAGLFATGMSRRRTYLARENWSRALGFQRLLSTPSAEDRFDYAARGDLWIAYVPYAVAFGTADAWAQKYRAYTGHEPPAPTWYPVHAYYGASMYSFGSGFDSFDAAIASSVAAYTAAHSSSGSGGGGGGGFGGGGGGGGGSW